MSNSDSFYKCENLQEVLIPNATQLNITKGYWEISKQCKIFIRRDAEVKGDDFELYRNRFQFIDDNIEISSKQKINENHHQNDNKSEYIEKGTVKTESNQNNVLNDDDSDDGNEENPKEDKENIFIDENDEEFHKIISQNGEGTTSETFKVIDERTGVVMCKKVLKNVEDNEFIYENARNSLKEITLLLQIDHPCVCKGIGINIQERTADGNTTIAIFTEFHPYDLRKLLEIDILNNTLKTRIALEIAFGMRHIHSLGMIHRDLKIENIMLIVGGKNYISRQNSVSLI